MTSRMRRVGCAALVALAALCGAPLAVVGSAFIGNGAIVDGSELPGGAITVQDGYVSVFLAEVGGGKLALVDAGNDPAGAAIDRALAARGKGRDDVIAILLTHGHPDHVAACGGFPQARIYALREEIPLLEGQVAARGPLPRLFGARRSPCPSERTVAVTDGAVVGLGDAGAAARAFAIPGHTAGSAAWLLDGTLFLGDAADASSDGELTVAKWVFTDDQPQAARSLVALADRLEREQLEVRALAFSHTGTLDGVAPLAAFAEAR